MRGYNRHSTFSTIGASNTTAVPRHDEDYYATDPKALELLLDIEQFNHKVWECACGEGHLSKVLVDRGYEVLSTDIIDRGYGQGGVDFLATTGEWDGDILTNPPYRYAVEFIEHRLSLIPTGNRVIMFLKLLFLESKRRGQFFRENPPKVIYVSRQRIRCRVNGDFAATPEHSRTAYRWFIWEKGFQGDPIIKWFN